MNEPEAFKLLALASARDGRTVDPAVAKVWAEDLKRIDFGDAVEALSLHFRESTDWLLPAHVIRCVRRVKDNRERELRRTMSFADRQRLEDQAEMQRLGELGVL